MPPLTLEQVLARSMRLPRKNAKRIISPATGSGAPGLSVSSQTTVEQKDKGVAKLFSLIEKEEEAVTAGRPSIHQSNNMIRNSQDLLTYLHAAKRMGAWDDALRFFSECTKMLLIKESADGGAVSFALREEGDDGVGNKGVTPTVMHLSVLLDTCARAKQWHIIEQLGVVFKSRFPQVVVDVVSLLAATKKADVGNEEGLYGWELALCFLQTRIPPEERPVEAYNACLSACERLLEWEAALAIVRAMGPNAIQNMGSTPLSAEGKVDDVSPAGPATETTHSSVADRKDDDLVAFCLPQPDVVTYATLISVLEQSGKDALASEVLQRLPPLEKEEITASYAALIYIWSEQKYRKYRRRF